MCNPVLYNDKINELCKPCETYCQYKHRCQYCRQDKGSVAILVALAVTIGNEVLTMRKTNSPVHTKVRDNTDCTFMSFFVDCSRLICLSTTKSHYHINQWLAGSLIFKLSKVKDCKETAVSGCLCQMTGYVVDSVVDTDVEREACMILCVTKRQGRLILGNFAKLEKTQLWKYPTIIPPLNELH